MIFLVEISKEIFPLAIVESFTISKRNIQSIYTKNIYNEYGNYLIKIDTHKNYWKADLFFKIIQRLVLGVLYKSLSLRTQWKYHFITGTWSYYTRDCNIIYMITWQFLHGRRGYIKLLQYPSNKQEKLFFSQTLAGTMSLSNWKRNDVIVV